MAQYPLSSICIGVSCIVHNELGTVRCVTSNRLGKTRAGLGLTAARRRCSCAEAQLAVPDNVGANTVLCNAQPRLGDDLTRTASPFKPYRPATPQLWSSGGEHSRLSAASGDNDPESPFGDDWEVEGEALEVCRNPDGTPIVLGQGSFGTVSMRMLAWPTTVVLV